MPYKRFRIKNKWPILLLMAIVLAIIFIALPFKEVEREDVPLKGIVSKEEVFNVPDVKFKPDEKTEYIKTQEAHLKNERGMPAPSSTGISGKPFAIQVCSFQNKNRSETALKRLKKENYSAYIVTQDLAEKGVWHRVWVGAFKTKEEAEKLLKEIKKDYKDSFIISR